MSVKRGMSPHEIAYVACWYWIGPDPSKWAAILPPYAKSKAVLSDPAGWAKIATPQALVVRDAVAIPIRESDGEPDVMARSDSGPSLGNYDHGLYQISGRWQFPNLVLTPDWRNPWVNGKLAKLAYDAAGGWSPWSVFTSGIYQERWCDAQIALNAPIPPVGWPRPGEEDPADRVIRKLDELTLSVQAIQDDLENITPADLTPDASDALAAIERKINEIVTEVLWVKRRFAQ